MQTFLIILGIIGVLAIAFIIWFVIADRNEQIKIKDEALRYLEKTIGEAQKKCEEIRREKDAEKEEKERVEKEREEWKQFYMELLNKEEASTTEDLDDLKDLVEEKENRLEDINDDIYRLGLACSYLQERYANDNAQTLDLASQRDEYRDELEVLKEEMRILKPQHLELINEIEELKKRHRESVLRETRENADFEEFKLSEKEKHLIEVLDDLKRDYGELKVEFATIEWRKIWWPKIQEICVRRGWSCKGIYRLVLKSKEDVCYVGQAQDIQKRWYEHIKKMIGVDTKGGELLYDYRPDEFYWTVIETDSKDLNSSERYWIDFYGCKEIGLNKK